MTSIHDLMSGARTAKWPNVGDVVRGTIVSEPKVRQATEFGTGKPLFWDDGKPQEQVVITLATDQRDPADPTDDGLRSVYVKAWGDQIRGLRAAVQASGGQLAAGGQLAVRFAGQGQATGGGFPPNIYEYHYIAPPSAAAALVSAPAPQQPAPAAAPAFAPQAFAGGGAQAAPAFGQQAGPPPAFAQAPAPQAPQAAPAPAPTAAPGFTPEQIAAMQAAGVQIPGM